MRYEKVLLANLIAHERSFWSKRAVLRAGMGYIAQSMYDAGVDYRVIDAALGYGLKDIIRVIEDFKPQLLAVTLFTYKYLDSYNMLKIIKDRFKGLKIVCGGPHITTFKDEVLVECDAIDYGIVFEGELSIVDLCKGLDEKDISGLIYRSGNDIIMNNPAGFITELDSIQFPKFVNFELEHYPVKNSLVEERIIPIVSSRGCPYNCIYCTVSTVMGKRFRFRSIENIISEIEYWYLRGYRKFSIVDDNFTFIKKRVLEFCEKVSLKKFKDISFLLHNGIRADRMDREVLSAMKEAGFTEIGIGVESADDRILEMLNKNERLETIENAISISCDLGFYVELFFLVGSPGETYDDVMKSAVLATKYPINYAFFFNLIPYPKTLLYEWVKSNGRFIYKPEYYLNKINSSMNKPVFDTFDFPVSERKRALIESKRIFLDYKRKQYYERLKNKGLPGLVSYIISKIYMYRIVQLIFNDVYLFKRIKQFIWKKIGSA